MEFQRVKKRPYLRQAEQKLHERATRRLLSETTLLACSIEESQVSYIFKGRRQTERSSSLNRVMARESAIDRLAYSGNDAAIARMQFSFNFDASLEASRRVRKLKAGAMMLGLAVSVWFIASAACGEEAAPKFLGAASCNSSSCHGGASAETKQYTVWSNYDVHHARPYATLTTARSAQLAAAAKLGEPTQNARCTVCHAPMATVPASRRAKGVEVNAGVSCENCHGPAENWLRSHTRTDLKHGDKVALGMRDLKNLYARANTCVACHQNVDSDLLAAGHPELIFELDGQAVTMPKHWRESTNWHGAQAWLVGQAVALREMSWQSPPEKIPDENSVRRWAGLFWLVHEASAVDRTFAEVPGNLFSPTNNNLRRVLSGSDQLAQEVSALNWNPSLTKKWLDALAGKADAFGGKTFSTELQGRQAERLVLALDRLVADLNLEKRCDAALNQLFKDVQSLPDFDPAVFAEHLSAFKAAVSQRQ
jgi:hypothetical protein